MTRTNYVIVAADTGFDLLLGAVAGLAGRTVAVVVGSRAQAEAFPAGQVDEVIWIECPDDVPAEAFAPAVARAVVAAPGVLVSGRDPASRVLLGAAAAAVTAPVVTGMIELVAEGELTLVTTGVYGGIARRTVAHQGPVAVLMDGGNRVGTGDTATPTRAAAVESYPIVVTKAEPPREGATRLGDAQRVLGIGRGLKAREDLPLVAALASALGAELGCTRPLAEGLEWLARDRYIGISGQHIAPRLYLAVGISGQLQHMSGVRDAGTIVAVNSDESAPIAKDADYLVVGDLYQVVPAITAALG